MQRVGVIGLGYVGLPLAVAMAEKYNVIGYDIQVERVEEILSGYDRTNEVGAVELHECGSRLLVTNSDRDIKDLDFYIVTVPTPVDSMKKPDLSPLKSASRLVGRSMGEGAVVIYESTVYPGATEEVCVPILEAESGLTYGVGFHVGYSPERINPGD